MRAWIRRCVVLLGVAAVLGGAMAADITIQLRIPRGATPTIVTDTDNSGLYKFARVGQNAFRLVNFDANVNLKLVQDAAVIAPETTIILGGANGPDPLPTLTVVWAQTGVQPYLVTLYPGQSSSCAGCDVTIKLSP